MGKKEIGFTLFFIICITVILVFGGTGNLLASISALSEQKAELQKRAFEEIYELRIELSQIPPGIISTYIPNCAPADGESAKTYAKNFDIRVKLEEEENYFSFSYGGERLYVDRTMNRLKYKRDEDSIKSGSKALEGDEEALDTAENFIRAKKLSLDYETAVINFSGEFYELIFLNSLGGIKNFGLANKVKLDSYGNVREMDYYYLAYEKFHSVRIKSQQDAFYELPLNEEEKIYIEACQLVYIYQNSIIQPAYLFEGYKSGGDYFQAFVPAAVYGSQISGA